MAYRSKKLLTGLALAIPALWLAAAPAAQAALVIAYEWTEGGAGNGVNSAHVSRHGVRGPVLADDFIPAISGNVARVDWWGSAPLSVGAPDQWEITFHFDNGGVPFATAPGGGISQHFVSSGGLDPDGDSVFFYSAAWTPLDLWVTAGTDYWFSVANFLCAGPISTDPTAPACSQGWTWANVGGAAPTVGSESWSAAASWGIGLNGGPHFGPWNTISGQDFAFRIWVEVPEPATLALFGLGLIGLGLLRQRLRAQIN